MSVTDKCLHDGVKRKDIINPEVDAILGVKFVGAWFCLLCGQRFAPINSDERVEKIQPQKGT